MQETSRLLYDNNWFDPVVPGTIYERSFQDIISSNSSTLFPDWRCIEYDRLLTSPEGNTKADLALIAKDYTNWVVVEVESVTHSMDMHIRPQIIRQTLARYGYDDAEWILDRYEGFNGKALRELFDATYPTVFVITDGYKFGWDTAIHAIGAKLMTIQIFRNKTQRHILEISGDTLPTTGKPLTYLRHGKEIFAPYLHIENSDAISEDEGDMILVHGAGTITRCRLIRLRELLYLDPQDSWPWKDKKASYEVRKSSRGGYYVRLEEREIYD